MAETTSFTVRGIIPDHPVQGFYQRLTFNKYTPVAKVQASSKFVPTAISDSVINYETRNYQYSGFRFKHVSALSDVNAFGSFKLQSFIGDGDGTDVFGFNGTDFSLEFPFDVKNNRIKNVATPVDGTDAANKDYVLSMASGGSVALTGNVTGTGVVGTPFATTITSKLNEIPLATSTVNLNNQPLTNVNAFSFNGAGTTVANSIIYSNASSSRKLVLFYPTAYIGSLYQHSSVGADGTGNLWLHTWGDQSVMVQMGDESTASRTLIARLSKDTSSFLRPIYGRRPGVAVHLSNNSSGTLLPTTSNVRITGAHATSTTPSEFVVTTSNPVRLTFTPSESTTNILSSPSTFLITASLSFKISAFAPSATFRFLIYKNGSLISGGGESYVYVDTVSQLYQAFVQGQTTMAAGDYIEFYCGADVVGTSPQTGVAVQYGSFSITAV